MNTTPQKNGFMQIIIIIILLIVVISLLGISLKDIFTKLSDNPSVNENFSFVTNWLSNVYHSYLAKPISDLFLFVKDYVIFKIFPEAKPATQLIQ